MPTAYPGPASRPLLGFGDFPGAPDRAVCAEDPGSCSAQRLASYLLLGLLGSAGCSDCAAGTEDPEGCSASRAGLLFYHVFGQIPPHLVK